MTASSRPIFDQSFYDDATFDASYYSNIYDGEEEEEGSGQFPNVGDRKTGRLHDGGGGGGDGNANEKEEGGWMGLFRLTDEQLSWAVSECLFKHVCSTLVWLKLQTYNGEK